jgi:hypothetical protein
VWIAAALVALLSAWCAPASAATVPNPTITFVTVSKQPGGGEIRRATTTLVDVSTPLRVDAGAGPDLLATVVLLSLNRISLVIDRLPGSTAPLPASIEAVAHDPLGTLGRQRLAVGYDARGGRAPQHFKATVFLGAGGDIGVQQDVTGATDGLATLASLFDPGAGGTRLRPERIAVGFAPVPASLRVDAKLATPHVHVRIATAQRTTATVDGALDDGTAVQTLQATVAGLPRALDIDYDENADHRPVVTYQATERIDAIRARYEHHGGGGPPVTVTAAIAGLPSELRFALTGDASGVFTTNEAIGQVDIAAASNHEPLQVGGTEPGVRIVATPEFASFAVRLRGLQSASVDAGNAIHVDATIARQPFGVSVHLAKKLRVDGAIKGLPSRVQLGIDLARGAIDYEAGTEAIKEIALVAKGSLLPLHLHRIAATIRDLPSGHVRFTPGQLSRIAFDGAEPIRLIDVVATAKNQRVPNAHGRDVIYLRDGRRFAAHVRVSGLRVVRVTLLGKHTPLRVSLERRGGRPIGVNVRARVNTTSKEALAVKGTLTMPGKMRLRLAPGRALHLTYAASGRGAIHLSARGAGLPKAARSVRVDVDGLPRTLTVDQSHAGNVFEATASEPIRSLGVAIAARGIARPVSGSGPGLRIVGSSEFAVRVRGLRRFVVRTKDPLSLDATIERQPFAVTVDQPGLRVTGTLANLPHRLGLRLDLRHGRIDYDGGTESIERVAAALTSQKPIFQGARHVALTIDKLPSVHAHYDLDNGRFSFDASAPLGTVDLAAWEQARAPGAGTAGRDLVSYRDQPGAFAARVRMTGVSHVGVVLDPWTVNLRRSGGRPIDVDVRSGTGDPLVVNGHVDGLPSDLTVKLGGEAGGTRVQYDAAEPLGGLHLFAGGGPLGANALVDITGLPRHVVVNKPRGDTFDVRADAPVGEVSVAYRKKGRPQPVAGSQPGVRVILDGPDEEIAARLRGIRSATLLSTSPLHIQGEIARQPLSVLVDSPKAGLRVTGTLANLPERLRLKFAPEDGVVEYDGGTQRIDRVTFDATSTKPLLLGRKHIFGTVLGLPSARLLLRGDGRGTPGVTLNARAAVDQVDVTLADGTATAPAGRAGHDLVYYHDLLARHVYRVRVSGVRKFRLALPDVSGRPIVARLDRASPVPVDVDVKLFIDSKKAKKAVAARKRPPAPLWIKASLSGIPGTLEFQLRTEGGIFARLAGSGPVGFVHVAASGTPLPKGLRDATLDVRGAPNRFGVGIPDSPNTQFTYNGSGDVRQIALGAQARGSKPLFQGATRVRAAVDGVPKTLTLMLSAKAGGVDFFASKPIGRLSLVATGPGNKPAPAFADGSDGLYYRDVRGRYAVRAQVTGLKRIVYEPKPLKVVVERPGARRLRLDLVAKAAGGQSLAPIRFTGRLDGLPDRLTLKYDTAAVHGKKGLLASYDATGPLHRLSLLADARHVAGVRGKLLVRVDRVPRTMKLEYRSVCAPKERDCGPNVAAKHLLATSSAPIGRLEVRASTGQFEVLRGDANKLVAGLTKQGGARLSARISNISNRLEAYVGGAPTRIILGTAGGRAQPPLKIVARVDTTKKGRDPHKSTGRRGYARLSVNHIPPVLALCFDRGAFCRRNGPRDTQASLRFDATPAPGEPPLEIVGLVCFRQVKPRGCTGAHASKLVVSVSLEELELGLNPYPGGFLFVNSVPEGGGQSSGFVHGQFGYFLSQAPGKTGQRFCYDRPRGLKWINRTYFRGTGSTVPSAIQRLAELPYEITLFGEKARHLHCDPEEKVGEDVEVKRPSRRAAG